MKRLSYETLREQGYDGFLLQDAPERFLQFGEGNFLRAFVDYFVDVMNEKCGFRSKVVIVQPTGKNTHPHDCLNAQEGLYTLLSRGKAGGRKVEEARVISSVSRCLNPVSEYDSYMACADNPALRFIISNTTEAGIRYDPACLFTDRPASSFPGKLTQFLYARYRKFGRDEGKGLVLLPCELIDGNGKALKECVLRYAAQWELGEGFVRWLEEENLFCSTLVDRIVTGYPKGELSALQERFGYEDGMMDAGEVFAFWAIEAPESLKEELPFEKAGLPVFVTDDCAPYKQRKVRILNGAHTSMVLGAYLAGLDIVRSCMEDETIRNFMNQAIYEEIIPTMALPDKELKDFADAVTDRFDNPFIDHELLAISLNSTSKWRERVLPSLKDYAASYGRLPRCLTASLAFYLAFYRDVRPEGDGFAGIGCGRKYPVRDDRHVLEFFYAQKGYAQSGGGAAALTRAVLANTEFWGEDLTRIEGLVEAVSADLERVETEGAYGLMKECTK